MVRIKNISAWYFIFLQPESPLSEADDFEVEEVAEEPTVPVKGNKKRKQPTVQDKSEPN